MASGRSRASAAGGDSTPPETAWTGKDKDVESLTPNAGKSKDGPSPRSESPTEHAFGKKKKDDSDEDAVTSLAGGIASDGTGSNLTVVTEGEVGKEKPPLTPGKDKGKSSPASSIGSKDIKPLRKRKRNADSKPRAPRGPRTGSKPKVGASKKLNKNFKVIRKLQEKHKRSFCPFIMKIFKDTQAGKRINAQAMMIHDSFANDLADKIIAAGSQLVAKSQKKQLASKDIVAAFKLVLPADMAIDAQKCMESSIKSYRESTEKYQDQIRQTDKVKAKVNKKDRAGGNSSPASEQE